MQKKENDILPIMWIDLVNGTDVACSALPGFIFTSNNVALILTSILNFYVDLLPEEHQNELEDLVIEKFKYAASIRHEFTYELDADGNSLE